MRALLRVRSEVFRHAVLDSYHCVSAGARTCEFATLETENSR